MTKARSFLSAIDGATSIEYAMIGGAIALAIVVGLTSIGTKLSRFFQQIAGGL